MSEQKRLDRPDREKIAKMLLAIHRKVLGFQPLDWEELEQWEKDEWLEGADQILALIPDIEQRVSQALEENTLEIQKE